VRRGTQDELSHSLAIYEIVIHSRSVDPKMYEAAAARLDDAKSLFEAIGVSTDPKHGAVALNLDRWPRLLLRVVEEQHDAEIRRLQDAAADGIDLPLRDVPVLLVISADIRKKLGLPPRRRRKLSFLERSREARRRRRRPRDHA
jgi:hypothetical protein